MHICKQCLSPLTLWVWTPLRRRVLDTTLCDKVCHWLATGQWFSLGTLVSSTNKTDRYNINEILLKVVLNIIILTLNLMHIFNTVICLYNSCLPSSAMQKWPFKRDVLSWGGQFSGILLSLCIWNLAWCMDLMASPPCVSEIWPDV